MKRNFYGNFPTTRPSVVLFVCALENHLFGENRNVTHGGKGLVRVRQSAVNTTVEGSFSISFIESNYLSDIVIRTKAFAENEWKSERVSEWARRKRAPGNALIIKITIYQTYRPTVCRARCSWRLHVALGWDRRRFYTVRGVRGPFYRWRGGTYLNRVKSCTQESMYKFTFTNVIVMNGFFFLLFSLVK